MYNYDLNEAVFTSKFVLENNSPILYIYHWEEDGYWGFFSTEECNDDEYRLISLKQALDKDNDIINVLNNIPEGYFASRDNAYSIWKIYKIDW